MEPAVHVLLAVMERKIATRFELYAEHSFLHKNSIFLIVRVRILSRIVLFTSMLSCKCYLVNLFIVRTRGIFQYLRTATSTPSNGNAREILKQHRAPKSSVCFYIINFPWQEVGCWSVSKKIQNSECKIDTNFNLDRRNKWHEQVRTKCIAKI